MRGSWVLIAWLTAAGAGTSLAGCGERRPAAERPYPLPVDVYADTGRGGRLRVTVPAAPAPRATVEIARVTPELPEALDPAPAAPESLGVAPLAPAPVVDEPLKPPLLRAHVPLAVPAGARGLVELDVRVDERGVVTDARPAGGSDDPAMVRAARECALSMRFYPAMRAGQPVAVWCRERFEFGGTGSGAEP